MSLVVDNLEIHDFRNIGERSIDLSPSITILHGKNATGKTNTIEALQLITTGTSFRHSPVNEMVREGEESGCVKGTIKGDGRLLDVRMDLNEGKRSFSRNGKKCRGADLAGTLMSILFCPDDLSLMKNGASYRRQEIDSFGCQASPSYRGLLRAFERAIEQRNRLLKEERVDVALLDAWDESVAIGGASLLSHRIGLFKRLRRSFFAVCDELVPNEKVTCSYSSLLGDDIEDIPRDEMERRLLDALAESRENDIRRQQTLIGPHHDDLSFAIDGRDVRAYGSQGQQRSLVLAWKMAEVRLSEEISGSVPLLLLDDVMSELDEERRSAVLSFVNNGIQTVLSTTNLGYFSDEELAAAKVVNYGNE